MLGLYRFRFRTSSMPKVEILVEVCHGILELRKNGEYTRRNWKLYWKIYIIIWIIMIFYCLMTHVLLAYTYIHISICDCCLVCPLRNPWSSGTQRNMSFFLQQRCNWACLSQARVSPEGFSVLIQQQSNQTRTFKQSPLFLHRSNKTWINNGQCRELHCGQIVWRRHPLNLCKLY